MYQLTIRGNSKEKDFFVEFDSRDQMDAYINSEYKYTFNELKNHFRAFSKEERELARKKLYIARMHHMNVWFKKEEPKQYA